MNNSQKCYFSHFKMFATYIMCSLCILIYSKIKPINYAMRRCSYILIWYQTCPRRHNTTTLTTTNLNSKLKMQKPENRYHITWMPKKDRLFFEETKIKRKDIMLNKLFDIINYISILSPLYRYFKRHYVLLHYVITNHTHPLFNFH